MLAVYLSSLGIAPFQLFLSTTRLSTEADADIGPIADSYVPRVSSHLEDIDIERLTL